MAEINFSHIGLCVSDLDRSLRFYCDGLGFKEGMRYDVGNECREALEVEGDVRLTSAFIARGNTSIELLSFASPVAKGVPSESRGHLGLTHLSLYVGSVEDVGTRLVESGGTCLEETMAEISQAAGSAVKLCFFTDPDGTRVELMEMVPAGGEG